VRGLTGAQVVSSVDSSPEILTQVQEHIIPIVTFTLEHKMLGMHFVARMIHALC
jgi:hypothetical protein